MDITPAIITPAIKHNNPAVGALLAAPQLGGASAAPTLRHLIAVVINITTHDVGALLAAPRFGGASAAPTIDMFNCLRNNEMAGF